MKGLLIFAAGLAVGAVAGAVIVKNKVLADAKENMKILHPLPRIDEITPEVDNTPYAYYFKQAANGVYAREAILSLVLNKEI